MAPTYHLWLPPAGNVYDLFVKIIADLGTAYAGPFFEPHVTLLGSLPGTEEEISVRISQLGTSLQPFDLQMTEPAYGNRYFQCVFLKVQQTSAIMHAHELAGRLFGKKCERYMPHLSLLYGQYSLEEKKQIVDALPETLCLSFTVNHIQLIRAGSQDPQDWIPILTVPLSG